MLENRDEDSIPKASSWLCPFCPQNASVQPVQCPRCRAYQNLFPIRRYLGQQESGCDIDGLQQAVRRLLADTHMPEDHRHTHLALAFLNLGQPMKALVHLGALSSQRPDDADLTDAVSTLTQWLEGAINAAPHSRARRSSTTRYETTQLDLADLGVEGLKKD